MSEKGTVTLYGDRAEDLYGMEPEQTVRLTILASVQTIQTGMVSLSIEDVDIDKSAASVPEAFKRAELEMRVRNRMEPLVP